MSWIHGVRHRLATLFRPTQHEFELRQELEFHRSLDAQQLGDVDAARRRLGNQTYYQEETRRMTWLGRLDSVRQDAGYAWRSIRRTPGVTVMVILTLALGLGVNAATFTFLDRLYLRPPDGVVAPEKVKRWWFEHSAQTMADGQVYVSPGASYGMYRAVAHASSDPSRFALYDTEFMLFLRRGDAKTRMRGVFATASYFNVLGVRPALGRFYTAQEDSMGAGSRVIVVGHRFWQNELGGDTAILGSRLNIEYTDYTVVGIMQPGFEGLELQAVDVWLPLASIPPTHWMVQRARWWESFNVNGMAVLQRAESAGQDPVLEQRATLAIRTQYREWWGKNADTLARALQGPLYGGGPGKEGQDMKIAKRLGAVSVIILLIACANVINLLLARADRRRREIAVRLALGISRSRLVRLLTLETVLLAVLACGAAVVAGWWGGTLLRSLLFRQTVFYDSVMHWRVVAFAFGLSLLAGVVAGVIPALQASNPRLSNALKEGTREGMRRSRLRSGLVVLQTALSVVLLAGAALFVRSLNNVRGLDIGYEPDRLVFGWVNFEPHNKKPVAEVSAALTELKARLESRPGIEAVALTQNVPMQAISFTRFFFDEDSSQSLRPNGPTFSPVSPEFFRTTGLSFLRGRAFSANLAEREVVINDAMAKRMWPAREALGRCIRFEKRDAACHTVVGVVENARRSSVIEDVVQPLYYLRLGDPAGDARHAEVLIARVRPEASVAARQEVMNALTAAFPGGTPTVQSMSESLEPEFWPWRLGATLFTAFGLLALVVAMIGIYSTVAYGVTQRRHEFGVRAALGARLHDVLSQVVGEGVRVVALGVVVGLALTLAAGKLIASLLFGVKPYDALTMLVVSAVLLAVAAVAAFVPAWRAARVDPVSALRAE